MAETFSCSTLIEQNGSYLLVQEGLDPSGRFSLPGGGPKKREDIFTCAVRETAEESGLYVALNQIVDIQNCTRTLAGNNLVRFIFSTTVLGGEITPSEKHPYVDYFDVDTIAQMEAAGQHSYGGILKAIKKHKQGTGVGLGHITVLPKAPKEPKDRLGITDFGIDELLSDDLT